ncbi:hypothetical protein QLX08_002257 [Tetragonisca angustula]|uniref:Uncharacterized protein n=1 Tax=Tetragonisca angustula TaxID=166442 RepID=A0AAW1ABS7_9HYME
MRPECLKIVTRDVKTVDARYLDFDRKELYTSSGLATGQRTVPVPPSTKKGRDGIPLALSPEIDSGTSDAAIEMILSQEDIDPTDYPRDRSLSKSIKSVP